MRLYTIDEPELQFADGRHVCPMAGIAAHGVYDAEVEYGLDSIRVGGVGTPEDLRFLNEWLDRCSKGIDAPPKVHPLLFPSFPGFKQHTGFRAELIHEEGLVRSVPKMKIGEAVREGATHNQRVENLASLYLNEVEHLAEHRPVDVIVCVTPDFLEDILIDKEADSGNSASGPSENSSTEEGEESLPEKEKRRYNFRRVLKARAMRQRIPLQLVWKSNLTESPAGSQNDATRAWNFMTALYYKAGPSIPWKLVEHPWAEQGTYVEPRKNAAADGEGTRALHFDFEVEEPTVLQVRPKWWRHGERRSSPRCSWPRTSNGRRSCGRRWPRC
jgi:hypothetical protein